MTSAARDLMDTGTPGPWRWDETHWRDYTDEGVSFVRVLSGTETVAATTWPGHDTDEDVQADARKIVLSVNALPLVDALCEAIDTIPTHGPLETRLAHLRHVWAARDALEAALRGEGA